MSRARPVVLHVVHGLGSGVERVVRDYSLATPELEHHVVHSTDPSCHGDAWAGSGGFSSVREVTGSPLGFVRALRRAHREIDPDVVHAHSSVAGAVVRAVLPRARVVYTPHCFAFVRRDVGPLARGAFWLAEAALARRTTALAACSPHEARLATRFTPQACVHYVPNVATSTGGDRPERQPRAGRPTELLAMGRISPQKAPETFAALADALRGHDVHLTWVGAGAERETARLEAAGVEVTGWLDHDEAAARLARADAYVHTALWEATPLTILEAARLDVPVLARETAPIRALGLAGTWTGDEELLSGVRRVLAGDALADLRATNQRLRAAHTPQRQREALLRCYAVAASRTGARSGHLSRVPAVAAGPGLDRHAHRTTDPEGTPVMSA